MRFQKSYERISKCTVGLHFVQVYFNTEFYALYSCKYGEAEPMSDTELSRTLLR